MPPMIQRAICKLVLVVWFLSQITWIPTAVIAADGPAYALPDQSLRIGVSEGWIGPLAFSPDGRYLAVGTDAGVRIYNLKDLSLRKWIQLAYQIDDLAFSPDGKLLAAISHYIGPYKNTPNLAHIWKTATWSLVNTVEDGKGFMTGLVWDPSGRSFITSRAEIDKNNAAIYQWYASGAAASAYISLPTVNLAVDDRGRWLFAVTDNGAILRYRQSDGELLDRFGLLDSKTTTLTALPEGAALLSADSNGRIFEWDLTVSPPHPTTIREDTAGLGLSLTSDGALLATCLTDGRVALQIPEEASLAQEFALNSACVRTRFSPDTRWLAVSLADGSVRLIPLDRTAIPPARLRQQALEVLPPADTTARYEQLDLPVLPESTLRPTTVDRLAVVRSGMETSRVLEIYGSQLPSDFAVHARNGRLLNAYYLPLEWEATLDTDTVRLLSSFAEPTNMLHIDGVKIHTAVFSGDGSLLAAGTEAGAVSIWNMPDASIQCSIYRHPVQVKALKFNHQGSLLAIGYDDLTIEMYSLPDCGRIARLPATTRHINDLEFSPDDTMLISAAADTSAQVFEIYTGRLLDRLEPDHAKKGLHTVAIHPGQVILAVGSYEGVLTFFNLRTGQFLARYRPGTTDNPITDLVFTTGGDQLLVYLADNTWVVYAAPG